MFRDLVDSRKIKTELECINCIITYDSKHTVVICGDAKHSKASISCYSLKAKGEDSVFTKNLEGDWIVLNEIEQCNDGEILVVPYSDNGKMRVTILTNTGEEIALLDINEICGIDEASIPVVGFMNPMITACFDANNDLIVQAFHRFERKHYLFKYSWKDNEILVQPKIT